MNRMKQILEGNDIELLLNEVISNVFHKGLIDISDSETLSLIKVYYPQIFALKEIEILRFMALFYKDLSEPKTLKEQIFRMYQDVIYEHYNYTYTPVQVGIASGIAQNRVFSFSAPTSTGKSYLIMNLIRDCDTDVVVVVPSRALINEYYSKLCNLIPDKSVNILTFVEKVNTAHANKNVFIVTPERCREIFKYANDFNIGLFLFDEAQLSNEENLRGMYFDNIIRRCHDKFKNAKLVFAQPFIENPASQIERNNLGNEQTDFRRYKHRNVGQLYLTYDNSEFFHFGINKEIMGSRKIKCNFDPILKCIKEEGSVLFYVSKSKILSREFYQEFKPYISLCKKISDKRALDLISRIQMYTGGKTDYSDIKIGDCYTNVLIDYPTISVVLGHLWNNAIKYIYKGSSLDISFYCNENNLTTSIKMYSLKIENDEIEDIYTEGYSGKWAKMISKDGHGIGMFYIKHLIEMNGGYFSINAGVNVTNINGIPYANNEFLLSLPLDI